MTVARNADNISKKVVCRHSCDVCTLSMCKLRLDVFHMLFIFIFNPFDDVNLL